MDILCLIYLNLNYWLVEMKHEHEYACLHPVEVPGVIQELETPFLSLLKLFGHSPASCATEGRRIFTKLDSKNVVKEQLLYILNKD